MVTHQLPHGLRSLSERLRHVTLPSLFPDEHPFVLAQLEASVLERLAGLIFVLVFDDQKWTVSDVEFLHRLLVSTGHGRTPQPHQSEAVAYFFRTVSYRLPPDRPGAPIFSDDMGLGKTFTVIFYLVLRHRIDHLLRLLFPLSGTFVHHDDGRDQDQPDHHVLHLTMGGPALIMVPPRLMETWQKEFAQVSPKLARLVYVWHQTSRSDLLRSMISPATTTTTSSSTVSFGGYLAVLSTPYTVTSDFRNRHVNDDGPLPFFHHVFCDEAHQSLINPRTKVYRTIFQRVRRRFFIPITGTLPVNSHTDILACSRLAQPDAPWSSELWWTRIGHITKGRHVPSTTHAVNLLEKLNRMRQELFVRRLQNVVVSRPIPPLHEIVHHVPLTLYEWIPYYAFLQEMWAERDSLFDDTRFRRLLLLTSLTRMQQIVIAMPLIIGNDSLFAPASSFRSVIPSEGKDTQKKKPPRKRAKKSNPVQTVLVKQEIQDSEEKKEADSLHDQGHPCLSETKEPKFDLSQQPAPVPARRWTLKSVKPTPPSEKKRPRSSTARYCQVCLRVPTAQTSTRPLTACRFNIHYMCTKCRDFVTSTAHQQEKEAVCLLCDPHSSPILWPDGSRIEWFIQYIRTSLVDEPHLCPLIVFCPYVSALELLAQRLRLAFVPSDLCRMMVVPTTVPDSICQVMDSSRNVFSGQACLTSEQMIEQFGHTYPILLTTPESGACGFTLTQSHRVIFLAPTSWNEAQIRQGLCRAQRQGQKHTHVTVIRLYSGSAIEAGKGKLSEEKARQSRILVPDTYPPLPLTVNDLICPPLDLPPDIPLPFLSTSQSVTLQGPGFGEPVCRLARYAFSNHDGDGDDGDDEEENDTHDNEETGDKKKEDRELATKSMIDFILYRWQVDAWRLDRLIEAVEALHLSVPQNLLQLESNIQRLSSQGFVPPTTDVPEPIMTYNAWVDRMSRSFQRFERIVLPVVSPMFSCFHRTQTRRHITRINSQPAFRKKRTIRFTC